MIKHTDTCKDDVDELRRLIQKAKGGREHDKDIKEEECHLML
jgi:hypothetical protein